MTLAGSMTIPCRGAAWFTLSCEGCAPTRQGLSAKPRRNPEFANAKAALNPRRSAGSANPATPTPFLDTPRTRSYRAKKMSTLPQTQQFERNPRPAPKNPGAPISSSTSQPPALRPYYDTLFAVHGPQHWWPGRTPFEIIVGAILVQNTSWTNVATAIENLRREKLLTPRAIESISTPRLARLIRSSGYFRQKTKKLKTFVSFLRRDYQGSMAKMFRSPTAVLRQQLLDVHGIGPETADSILLYAGNHPVFVVDAYTLRILERHSLASVKLGYEDVRQLFEQSLPRDPALYNEFHALIVHTGKHFCRPREPRCGECPLNSLLPVPRSAQPVVSVPERAPEYLLGSVTQPLPVAERSSGLSPERTAAT
jgi:endonuclease III related protein